jgi:hypothetical protein
MLERMIVDISKWIVIILIFFIAFACSLYLIFSFYAVALEQQEQLKRLKDGVEQQSSLMLDNTTIKQMTMKCPDLFYSITNLSGPYSISYAVDKDTDDEKISDYCKKTDDYEKIKNVGPRPAIHYFGKSFGATVLTTFFTLFGAGVQDGIPVRRKNFLLIYFLFLRIEDMNLFH